MSTINMTTSMTAATIFNHYAGQLSYTSADIIALFDQARGWEAKYRQIMLLGKQLPALDEQYKQDSAKVKGCESQVWLHHEIDEQGLYHFAADSDARIIKGLVIVILAAYNQLTAKQIKQFDIEAYFAQLDLLKHLSPSRSNGIHAIVRSVEGIVT
ncbi:MAG: cysteine desulfuration protein SufE [Alteromonadaceae bacterium]|jgi:cysteine desulfuration protein SufE